MARHKKNLKQPILLPKNIRKKENKAQSQPEKENSKGYRGSKWNSFPLKNDIKWNQDGFFWKKKNRTDRLLNRLKTKQRERIHIKLEMKGEITTDTKKKNWWQYYKHLEEIDKFLETNKLPRMNQREKEIWTNWLLVVKLNCNFWNYQQTKHQA